MAESVSLFRLEAEGGRGTETERGSEDRKEAFDLPRLVEFLLLG